MIRLGIRSVEVGLVVRMVCVEIAQVTIVIAIVMVVVRIVCVDIAQVTIVTVMIAIEVATILASNKMG